MKNTILGACILVMLGFAYENVNDVVGKVIDQDEADYFRIFQDITNFKSARFFFSGESVVVEMNTGPDYSRETMYRAISMKSFIALDMYIEHFRSVIENAKFRHEFAEMYGTSWPVASDAEISRAFKEENDQVSSNRILCDVAGSSAVANAAGCISREEVEPPGHCTPPTLTIKPEIYCPMTAAGCAGTYFLGRILYKPYSGDNLLKKDILAFDSAGVPITTSEILRESGGLSSSLGRGCGCGLSIFLSAGTAAALAFSVISFKWDNAFSAAAVSLPIITLSISEFIILNTFFKRSVEAGLEKEAVKKIIARRRAKEVKNNNEPGLNE